jgi:hypothetical protein
MLSVSNVLCVANKPLMLSVVRKNGVMLTVIMLKVMAPFRLTKRPKETRFNETGAMGLKPEVEAAGEGSIRSFISL